MQKIDKKIEKNIQAIEQQYQNGSDLFSRKIMIGKKNIAIDLL